MPFTQRGGHVRFRIMYRPACLLPRMEFSLPCANIAEDGRVVIHFRAALFIYPYTEEELPVPVFKFVSVALLIRALNVKPFAATVRTLKLCHKNKTLCDVLSQTIYRKPLQNIRSMPYYPAKRSQDDLPFHAMFLTAPPCSHPAGRTLKVAHAWIPGFLQSLLITFFTRLSKL